MQGFILAYRPATGAGAILSDKGELFLFVDSTSRHEIEGGDRVSFLADSKVGSAAESPRAARAVRVVEKWARHASTESPAARQVWRALQIDQATA